MKPLAIAYPSSDMDRSRFSELIRDHHQPLLAYARVLAGNPGRARELVQQLAPSLEVLAHGQTPTLAPWLLNVNIPNLPNDQIKGVKIARLER